MGKDPGLTNALVVSMIGILVMIISVFSLGPVVDAFVYQASAFELSGWGQEMVPHVLVYAEWFYIIIKLVGFIFCIYPFIYLFRRHKYTSDEGFDPYWGQ